MIDRVEIITDIMRRRQTWKVLADPGFPITFSAETLQSNDAIVRQAIATAGMAPFHYDRGVDGIAEPWRVHLLSAEICRQIARRLPEWMELKPNNKLPSMLSACGCLLLVTWLPQFRDDPTKADDATLEKQTEIDDEHLAATGALVQNLLLLLTAAELGTYWSSGGQLGSREMFQRLGIQAGQRLIAAIFVEYPNGEGTVTERLKGKNRDIRSASTRWSAERTIQDL